MRYDLSKNHEATAAFGFLQSLVEQEKIVEIKTVRENRSLNQNRYLHLTLGIFGSELGYSIEESKSIYKREANPGLYVYDKNGRKFLRSSADLNTKEMSDSMENWRKYAADAGVDIPEPNEEEKLRYWNNQIEKNGRYL